MSLIRRCIAKIIRRDRARVAAIRCASCRVWRNPRAFTGNTIACQICQTAGTSNLPGYEGWTLLPAPPELATAPPFLRSPDGRQAIRLDFAEALSLLNDDTRHHQ